MYAGDLSVVRSLCAPVPGARQREIVGFPAVSDGEPAFMTLMWIQGLIELFGGALLALGLFHAGRRVHPVRQYGRPYFMGHASKGFFPLINGGDAHPSIVFIFLMFLVAGAGR